MPAPETRAVMQALTADGGEGALRRRRDPQYAAWDAMSPISISRRRLCREEVVRRLAAAKIASVPTGIAHGTVTAIANGKPFEVTTLRRDVATDGRRAIVAFSTDWTEDAGRRDFTINALYANADGEIFDFCGGLADLEAGRVRFIGDATARIREDYLRILRLFRFHAWYGKGEIDAEALHASAAEKAGIAQLSGERIQKEMLRLLEAENPVPDAARDGGVGNPWRISCRAHLNIARLERLAAIDSASFFAPDAVLRLAALLGSDVVQVQAVAERFKLSNADRARLEDLAGAKEKIVSYLSIREVRKLLYRIGMARFKDRVFLRWAEDPKESNAIQWRALLALADAWQRPTFPLTGRNVMAAGVSEGPLVGRILAEVEDWWIDSDFTEDEFSLAERLKAVVQATAY